MGVNQKDKSSDCKEHVTTKDSPHWHAKDDLRRAGHVEVDAVEGPGRATGRVGLGVGQLRHIQGMQTVHILVF